MSCVVLYLGLISLGYGKVRYGTFILESGVFWCWLLFFILLFFGIFSCLGCLSDQSLYSTGVLLDIYAMWLTFCFMYLAVVLPEIMVSSVLCIELVLPTSSVLRFSDVGLNSTVHVVNGIVGNQPISAG